MSLIFVRRSLSISCAAFLSVSFFSCKPRSFNSDVEAAGGNSSSSASTANVYRSLAGYKFNMDSNSPSLVGPTGGKSIVGKGTIERVGSIGVYNLKPEEGYVCGGYEFSRLDPKNEGSTLPDGYLNAKWLAPQGSVRSSCTSSAAAEGIYINGKAAKHSGGMIALFTGINSKSDFAFLGRGGVRLAFGSMEKDGTAGMSYNLRMPEGFVCGSYRMSFWDPKNEGSQLPGGKFTIKWNAPDGSVAKTQACQNMADVEGEYTPMP